MDKDEQITRMAQPSKEFSGFQEAQRTWVGLTGEEAMDVTRKEGHELLDFIYEYGTGSEGVEERIVAICKAIENKLRDKNT